AVRTRWVWAVGGAIVASLAAMVAVWSGQAQPSATAGGATLQIDATPAGAVIELDGQERGRVPADLSVAPGDHLLTVRRPGFLDAAQRLTVPAGVTRTATLELWTQAPRLLAVRPAFPGAAVSSVDFLGDGRIALAVTLPPGDERQLWLLDGDGDLRRFGPPAARGTISASPDGATVAYLARGPRAGFDDGR